MSDILDTDASVDDTEVDGDVRWFTAPFELRNADAVDGDGLTLEGYAAVFNSPTRINDRSGEYTEVIAPGAFKRTINSHKPVMQFDHGQHPLMGSLPIAAIKQLREDSRGLFVRARVFDNWLTEPLRDAIRERAITGMSFKFSIIKDDWQMVRGERVRTIKEVLLYELGPVVFPAYADTSVVLRSLERAAGVQILSPNVTSESLAEVRTGDEPDAETDPAARHSVRSKAQRMALATAFHTNP